MKTIRAHYSSVFPILLFFISSISNTAYGYWAGHDDPMLSYTPSKAWSYDTNDWMKDLPGTTKLGDISMVSSHDAGIDENSSNHPTVAAACHFHSIAEQLRDGARFFDIRLSRYLDSWVTEHSGSYGHDMYQIMDDAVNFLKNHSGEVVILKFSHWKRSEYVGQALNDIFNQHYEGGGKWTDWFYTFDTKGGKVTPPSLNDVALSELRGKILILIDRYSDNISDEPENALDDMLCTELKYTPDKGVWRFGDAGFGSKGTYGYFRVYDLYPGSNNYFDIVCNQRDRMKDCLKKYDASKTAFMLCWQQTYHMDIYTGAKYLAERLEADLGRLTRLFNERPRLVNLDYIDGRICNIVINTNYELINPVTPPAVSYLEPVFGANGKVTGYVTKQCTDYSVLSGYYPWTIDVEDRWYVLEADCSTDQSVEVSGNARIILKNGQTFTVTPRTGYNWAGIISKNGDARLTVYGQSTDENQMGIMTAKGNEFAAGIGGNQDWPGHHITINGGKVTATGGSFGAGIGGGNNQNGENIVINGGVVTAYGGCEAAGIGGGYEGMGRSIQINGGEVKAYGGQDSDGYYGGAGIGGGKNRDGYDITINGGTVSANGKNNAAGIGGGREAVGHDITINGGTVNATTGEHGAGIGGGLNRDGYNIKINGGIVTAKGGEKYGAGIGGGYGGEGHDITITGGEVNATGGEGGAGIGGGQSNGEGGGRGYNIFISGGDVTARGGMYGSGVGGGKNRTGEQITISDGTVFAYGGENGAGIGGGREGDGGGVTIKGGNVTASGGGYAAGIGGGFSGDSDHSGKGFNITIDGGNVRAYGTNGGAGIGGGKNRNGEDITINGGKVIAEGVGDGGAGIGGGNGGNGNRIYINGGYVKVLTKTGGGAGIGGGQENYGGAWFEDVVINGGTVDADSVKCAFNIGNGNGKYGDQLKVRINGGSVLGTRRAGSGGEIQAQGVQNAHNSADKKVYAVTVPDCGSSDTPVSITGLGEYGVKDLYPIDGKLKLFLPNGSYSFETSSYAYTVTVSNADVTATKTVHLNGVRINGTDIAKGSGTGWTFADNVLSLTSAMAYSLTGENNDGKVLIDVTANATVTLDSLRLVVDSPGRSLFNISAGDAKFVLKGTSKIYANGYAPISIGTGAKLTLSGNGVLSGGKSANKTCRCVFVGGGGEFVMNGGAIRDYLTPNSGAAIDVQKDGKAIINGGIISGNVTQNETQEAYGGGIYIEADGKLTVNGGTICGNTAKTKGNDIYNAGQLVVSGGSLNSVEWDGDKSPKNSSSAAVYKVTVPEVTEEGPVTVTGLSSYGVSDLYPDNDSLYFWLPDGSYNMVGGDKAYKIDVNGGAASAALAVEVTVGPSGYATVYSDMKIIVSSDLQFFVYSYDNSSKSLVPTEVPAGSVLPANIGFVVKGKSGSYQLRYSAQTAGTYDSVLSGVTVSAATSTITGGTKKIYVLGTIDGKTTFYEYSADTVPAGKAYFLMIP